MEQKNINFSELQNSLCYLHVSELKNYCEKLNLSIKGKKLDLINRIMHFVQTGEKIDLAEYPESSMSKGQKNIRLTLDALMLKGAYKNDLKTRLFFKTIIGAHFHFTAFGIDWLESRWFSGNPPTYKEFVDMWSREYEFRKLHSSKPKEEWAYINFVKKILQSKPNLTRNEILNQWNSKRVQEKDLVDKILNQIINNSIKIVTI